MWFDAAPSAAADKELHTIQVLLIFPLNGGRALRGTLVVDVRSTLYQVRNAGGCGRRFSGGPLLLGASWAKKPKNSEERRDRGFSPIWGAEIQSFYRGFEKIQKN